MKFSVINTVNKDTANFHKALPELLSTVRSGRHWSDGATLKTPKETRRIVGLAETDENVGSMMIIRNPKFLTENNSCLDFSVAQIA